MRSGETLFPIEISGNTGSHAACLISALFAFNIFSRKHLLKAADRTARNAVH